MNYLISSILFTLIILSPNEASSSYPKHWWGPTDTTGGVPSWEILPEAGIPNKTLILSKRNELGVLSNFAPTPFYFEGKNYASLEGFWQAMKYPEKGENRYHGERLPFSREEVEQMVAFEAKKAGTLASKLMKKYKINYVSFKGERFTYRTKEKGKHYELIKRAMREKLNQNDEVRDILVSTKGLELLPDHQTSEDSPPAWKYYKIWMEEREQLLQ
ncbi:MAG: hypothetical protein CME61_03285 [Halobacteriovoraceae bacterium]|nr:hypothetical protein [Halobacteriovoraceae bacterium]